MKAVPILNPNHTSAQASSRNSVVLGDCVADRSPDDVVRNIDTCAGQMQGWIVNRNQKSAISRTRVSQFLVALDDTMATIHRLPTKMTDFEGALSSRSAVNYIVILACFTC